jgi:phosphohistidine swiveling domain-containing protein
VTAVLLPSECREASAVGGKAYALARLTEKGFAVPPFLVVLPEDGAFETALDGVLSGHVGGGPYAVRSSGTQEDGSAHSHAGQFLSLLDVPAGEVADAVRRVAASAGTEGVREYRDRRGIAGEGRMAVVVQAMVKARAAGVLFTADPVTGRRDRIVVSATEGLADRLVGGEADGASYVLDKRTGEAVARPAAGPLSDQDLAALWREAIRAEEAFGGAQDVEWAFEGERLFLVQSRPITTPLRPMPVADDARTILDNSNIVESYPGLVSPLTYSFASYVYARVYRTFLEIVGVSGPRIREHGAVLDNMLARLDGRVYYNLINWYRALSLLPGFSSNRKSMETMMGVSEPLPDGWLPEAPPADLAARLRNGREMLRIGVRLAWRAFRLSADVADFNRRLGLALATDAEAVRRMSLSDLAREYRRIEADLLDRWDAPLVNDFLCMAAFGASRRLLERWCGAEGLAFHNDVMIGQGDIVSAEPAQRIRAMGDIVRSAGPDKDALIAALAEGDGRALDRHPALAAAVTEYVARFGDRCTQELKLESVTLAENPAPLLRAVAAAARAETREVARGAAPEARLAAMFKGRPLRRLVASALVRYAKARVRDRENLRFERTRIFGHARRVFMAMGCQMHALGLLDAPEDVLHLTVHEVLGAVEGSGVTADLRGLAALRRREEAANAAKPDPPERILVRGPVRLAGEAVASAAVATADDGAASRQGTGCSAGIVTGVARVIHDPLKEQLAPGEILVARHTDPGWIAVFANASAIVVERGSLLSHSAIVARELGIPCVVGLKDATRWIASGERIEVDGGGGLVTRR